ncbi:MAG: metallophosphoesterase [Spirochaeta sp.]
MQRQAPPEPDELLSSLQPALEVLHAEKDYLRPHDKQGKPGGIVRLSPVRTTVVIPDVHARMDLVRRIMDIPVQLSEDATAPRLATALQQGRAQLVFVGDYVHAEQREADRWRAAMQEFLEGFKKHRFMDEEMRESLGTIQMLACIKAAFPEAVHLLKGNHENILNQEGEGNHAFGKFAYEGQMVATYMQQFYPAEVIQGVDDFERSLPLLAVGAGFLVSHAEPKRAFTPQEIRDFRSNPDVIEGLTWTDNGEAEEGSVAKMLSTYTAGDSDDETYYFAGHRPVSGRFGTRADGRFIQLHNPSAGIAAVISPDRRFDPEEDILYI